MQKEDTTVLITGSEGFIGGRVAPYLQDQGYRVRGFDLAERSKLTDYHRGSIADPQDIDRALAGVDTVIHLAAKAEHDCDFVKDLLEPNVQGLYEICEGCRRHAIRRLILASSVQVVWGYRGNKDLIGLNHPVTPPNMYAMTKVLAETSGEMLARCHGVSVIAARIGWYIRTREEYAQWKDTDWLRQCFISHADAGRFFDHAIQSTRPAPGDFAALFLISGSDDDTKYDMSATKDILGFEPLDLFPHGLDFAID
jgi:nucleoside-diphosphate-sugar epimerase